MLAGLFLLAACLAGGLVFGPIWGAREASDRPAPALLPEGGLHIVTYGTSLTALYSWPDDLALRLETCMNRPVRITRVARPGAGSDWALTRLEEVRAAGADLVVMEFAINDADLTDGASFTRARSNHETILDSLTADTPVILMTMNPVTGIKRLSRPALGRYYGLYSDLAERFETGLLDLAPRWRVVLDDGGVLPDGLHPNETDASGVIVAPLAAMIGAAAGADC